MEAERKDIVVPLRRLFLLMQQTNKRSRERKPRGMHEQAVAWGKAARLRPAMRREREQSRETASDKDTLVSWEKANGTLEEQGHGCMCLDLYNTYQTNVIKKGAHGGEGGVCGVFWYI